MAMLSLSNTGLVMATAQATGGSGATVSVYGGAALAHAAANGSGGCANAQAATSGGLLDSLSVTANVPLIERRHGGICAAIAQAAPLQSLAGGLSAASFATLARKLSASCHGKSFHLSEHLAVGRGVRRAIHLSMHR